MTDTHEALHEAIRVLHTERVEQLLAKGLSPCYEDYKENCFHLALDVTKLIYLIKFLRCQPAAVNCRDEQGNTLLIRANKRKYFRLLAQYNPDPHLRNNKGDNVLLHAFKTQANVYEETLDCILKTGVDINARDANGKTALECALECRSGRGTLIEMLLKHGAKIPPTDENGQTVTMRVVKEFRHFSVVHVLETLKKYGSVDTFNRDNEGRTAMHHAIVSHLQTNRFTHELYKITEFLFRNGCPLDCTDLKFERYICDAGNFAIMACAFLRDNAAIHDIISFIVRHCDITLLHSMFDTWLSQNRYIQGVSISPVTNCLLNFIVTPPVLDGVACSIETIDHCLEKFLKHDVTLSQHVLRFRNETARMWSDELNLPDTLWLYFLMFCKKRGSEHFLHKLVRTTWAHHPLCLLLFPLPTEIWRGAQHPRLEPILMFEALASIGGPMLPNSRLYHAVRGRLETLGPAYQPALEKFIQIHDGVQSLRQLCRTNVRTSFAEQAVSGIDLTKIVSKLWIPIELKNCLNFY